MKKRYWAMITAASICLAAVCGCAGSSETKESDTTNSAEAGESVTENSSEVEESDIANSSEVEESDAASTTETEDSDAASSREPIFVQPVENLPDDFYMGMDASSVLVEEKSGVKYYDFDGKEADPFETMAKAGVNYIRLRVWNDPFDEEGNGYGGGNNDVTTAIELGKRATQYGMKVCIDFHYSDFWADPKRQHAPKAWENMNIDEKCEAIYDFTKQSLSEILDSGVDVGMVQIGNEINNGMSGEKTAQNVTELLKNAGKAVREISESYSKDIEIVVHYANVDSVGEIDKKANSLKMTDVDYDILGLSYYPFWDGDFENIKEVIEHVRETYGKKVMIAETSYCYTDRDGDGAGNSLKGTDDLVEGYPASVQGQANMVRDVIDIANSAGAAGVFYWEGTWIPVGPSGADNSEIWEKYGSGWASSYAGDYDTEDAGKYYGGCSWDNQAMFDFKGYPLESLKVFTYVRTGSTGELKIEDVPDINMTLGVGETLSLPEEVSVVFNDKSLQETRPAIWNEEDIAKVDTSAEGKFLVHGSIEEGNTFACHIEVKAENYVLNPSFEDADRSMWTITYEGADPTDYQEKSDDAHTGDFALHFWSESAMDFTLSQEITGLEPGTYKLVAYSQGGDMDSNNSELTLFAQTSVAELTDSFMVTEWANWKKPEIPEIEVTDGKVTIGVRMKCSPASWGTVDDFELTKVD